MPWTEDIPDFRQNFFKFSENHLAEGDKLSLEIVKMLMHNKSSPSAVLASLVIVVADFIAANVDPDSWDEALSAVGLLVNAALARLGMEHGLLKIGSSHVH